MKITDLYNLYKAHPLISTDTRSIQPSALFFALKGPSFNGNAFAEKALESGAAFAIIDEPAFRKTEQYILVDDVLRTLQQLAIYHRIQLDIPVIGITGTNGKTTTKELIYAVLSTAYKAWATKGNLNNHIGVPVTLLSMPAETQIAIIEMGANHPGEIGFLSNICRPTHGIITNVGKAHLEGFGGFEGVIKTKKELYDYLRSSNGHLFIQGDNQLLNKMADGINNRTTYGSSSGLDVKGTLISEGPELSLTYIAWNGHKADIHTKLAGIYNFDNVLAAITAGEYFGLQPENIAQALESYYPSNNRSQVLIKGSNKVIMDAYNANPSSMEAALLNFEKINSASKILVLGDMFELGEDSYKEHRNLLDLLERLTFKQCILVGEEFFRHKESFKTVSEFIFVLTTAEAAALLKAWPLENSYILVKGSRGMKLEEAAAVIT